MKKVLICCLTFGLLFVLAGCGEKEEIETLNQNISQCEKEISNLKSEQVRLAEEIEKLKTSVSAQKPLGWTDVYDTCKASVVNLTILPRGWKKEQFIYGGGFIVNESGYVVTVGHMACHRGEQKAHFFDGKSHRYEIIVIADKGQLDVGLVKMDEDVVFTPAKLGDSSKVAIGDPVMAIGAPKTPSPTIVAGIVSALNQDLQTDYTSMTGLIQIDAGVSGGYSGGALINRHGEVIGIIAATAGSHIHFAIPIDSIRELLPEMLDVENRYGFILGMEVAVTGTATVTSVTPGSPAEAGGVKVGDLVTNTNGMVVREGIDFYLALIDRQGGEDISLELQRDGVPVDITVTPGKIKPQPSEDVKGLVKGLKLEYYEGKWPRLPDFDEIEPVSSVVTNTISTAGYKGKDSFGLRYTGYIKVPKDGVYIFYADSDDGSQLYVANRLVVDNDGLHPAREKRGIISLQAGFHPIRLTFFEGEGDEHLALLYEGPGIRKQAIPGSLLYHKE